MCFASQKPSEREFFVPAGTDLGVKTILTNNMYDTTHKTTPYEKLFIPRYSSTLGTQRKKAQARQIRHNPIFHAEIDKEPYGKLFTPCSSSPRAVSVVATLFQHLDSNTIR